MKQLLAKARPHLPLVALVIAIASTLISLGLSEILHWTPCVLCWYQRIVMYPLTAILAVGVVYKDRFVYRYVLLLSGLGMVIAGFHSLLQWGVVSEALAPCMAGVSCVVKHTNWFGFVTIPFLSFIAFSGITVLMLAYAMGSNDE